MMNCWQASTWAPALVSMKKQQEKRCISWKEMREQWRFCQWKSFCLEHLERDETSINVSCSPHSSSAHGGSVKCLRLGLTGNWCSVQGNTVGDVPCSSLVVLKSQNKQRVTLRISNARGQWSAVGRFRDLCYLVCFISFILNLSQKAEQWCFIIFSRYFLGVKNLRLYHIT